MLEIFELLSLLKIFESGGNLFLLCSVLVAFPPIVLLCVPVCGEYGCTPVLPDGVHLYVRGDCAVSCSWFCFPSEFTNVFSFSELNFRKDCGASLLEE